MSFFDKLKNVLFEDDEETVVEEEKKKEEPKKEEVRFSSQSNSTPEKKEEPKKEPSVFQSFDEEEFDRIAAINKNRLLERDRKAREEKEKEEEKRRLEARQERETLNAGYRRYEELRYGTSATSNKETKEEPKLRDTRTSETPKEPSEYRQNIYNKPVASKEPVKKFTPSPVISPVYGVLDKNYRKEDILPRASSEGTLPKIMDVDNVRKKAFGFLEKNIDTEENEPLKDFQGENEMQMADISKELDVDEEIGKTTRIDIRDVKEIEEDIKAKEEEPKEPTVKSNKNDEEDSLEKDLFNLIDSMYESREDK